jgi:glycosyltransferase involved in cell wall biosynthesis
MRIVIDLQGAQTESRFRGIGRYSIAFAKAVVRNRGPHEVLIALNGYFPESVEFLREEFRGLLPNDCIRVWHAPGPVAGADANNAGRYEVAEALKSRFLDKLNADIIHSTSMFEGFLDDAVTRIRTSNSSAHLSMTIHDFIPYIYADRYLDGNKHYSDFYFSKLEELKQAEIYLSVSESAKNECTDILKKSNVTIVNTSEAAGSEFRPIKISANQRQHFLERFDINKKYILYTGGADEHKNLKRLIIAYSKLGFELRDNYHLVFAGKIPDVHIAELKQCAKEKGLNDSDARYLGYVTDDELIYLYNLCTLFVFPSWHEGFGLPVLEAMSCGVPVIAANTSSLPEVVGTSHALFDPFDVDSITNKITESLTDEVFLTFLKKHGQKQASRFTWDKTAVKAINAWEKLAESNLNKVSRCLEGVSYNELIDDISNNIKHVSNINELVYFIALNEQSGIRRQILVDVSELSQRNACTGVQRVVRSYLKELIINPPKDYVVVPVYATTNDSYKVSGKVLTQYFGARVNEAEKIIHDKRIVWERGDIFLGLDMQHHAQLANKKQIMEMKNDGVNVVFLVHDLLPIEMPEHFENKDIKALHEEWLRLVASTNGVICVSDSTANSFRQWIKSNDITLMPEYYINTVHNGADIENSMPTKGLPGNSDAMLDKLSNGITFVCVSTIEPRKKQDQIFHAFKELWGQGLDVNLVLIGKYGWSMEKFKNELIDYQKRDSRFVWLDDASDEFLSRIYRSSTCLIAASLNEGFGLSVVEAAKYQKYVIARDIPVFRELANSNALYFHGEAPKDLSKAIKKWLSLYKKRELVDTSNMEWNTWEVSANQLKSIVFQHTKKKQLFVDVSELIKMDAGTGIQRVVRSIINVWRKSPPKEYALEFVYSSEPGIYRYANEYNKQQTLLDCEKNDYPIGFAPGDIFLALDFQPSQQAANGKFYHEMQRQGVFVYFIVYDLLPITDYQYFLPGTKEGYEQWLNVVIKSNGAICISSTVADTLRSWLDDNEPKRSNMFDIKWFHLGADALSINNDIDNLSERCDHVLTEMNKRKTFLMVGTLEPRKAHEYVLGVFEKLWSKDYDLNLLIVGKKGWMIDGFVKYLERHKEFNNRLFWVKDADDQCLQSIYMKSTCLIAASYNEGFGLPLIEAAQHGLPIIARDIPIFNEIAKEHATYFNKKTGNGLEGVIRNWISSYDNKKHVKSNDLPWLTWATSANTLLQITTDQRVN